MGEGKGELARSYIQQSNTNDFCIKKCVVSLPAYKVSTKLLLLCSVSMFADVCGILLFPFDLSVPFRFPLFELPNYTAQNESNHRMR